MRLQAHVIKVCKHRKNNNKCTSEDKMSGMNV